MSGLWLDLLGTTRPLFKAIDIAASGIVFAAGGVEAPSVQLDASAPFIGIRELDAPADAGKWRLGVEAAVLAVRCYSDAGALLRTPLTIDRSGILGIAKAPAAGYALDVQGTIRSIGGEATSGYGLRLLNAAGSGGGSLSANSGSAGGVSLSGDAGPLLLFAGAAERLRIDMGGNVGIGVVPNGYKLQVAGASLIVSTTAAGTTMRTGLVLEGGASLTGQVSPAVCFSGQNLNAAIWSSRYGAFGGALVFATQAVGSAYTDPAGRMTLDAYGNLGLYVVPSYWSPSFRAIEVGGAGSAVMSGYNSGTYLLNNSVWTAGGWTRVYANGTAAITLGAGNISFSTDASGAAGASLVPSERMRIDTAGNVLINSTSAVFGTTGRGTIEVNGTTAIYGLKINGVAAGILYHDSVTLFLSNYFAGAVAVQTNGAERLRIDQAGNVGVNAYPSAFGGGYKGIELNGAGLGLMAGAGTLHHLAGAYFNGWNWVRSSSTAPVLATLGPTGFGWYADAAGAAASTFAPTIRMSLSTAGGLQVYGSAGINGKVPVGAVGAPGGAFDLATAISLVNDIRVRLINFGIYA